MDPSADEYDAFFTPLPSDFDYDVLDSLRATSTNTNGQQRPLSGSTPTTAARQPKKIETDKELLERVQPMAAKTNTREDLPESRWQTEGSSQ